ncbi:12625_t:CDS:1 [Ambispora leptoticha]|uniref:12625_t:CDS:1 n=1 Tax=Ambispora leptoticha TaxID=144679 RepID=A0A9N9FN47_9GLOM|nr:12625_t:CDS:1 [Ambispora leptoticha]
MAQKKFFSKNPHLSLIITIILLIFLFTTPKVSLAVELYLQDIVVYEPTLVNNNQQLNITYFVFNDILEQFNITNLVITLIPRQTNISSNISVAQNAPLLGPNGENHTQTVIYNITKEVYGGTWSLTFVENYIIKGTGQSMVTSQSLNVTFPPSTQPTSTTQMGTGPITYVSTIVPASYITTTTTDAAGVTYSTTIYVPPIIQTVVHSANPANPTNTTAVYSPPSSEGKTLLMISNEWWSNKIYLIGIYFILTIFTAHFLL